MNKSKTILIKNIYYMLSYAFTNLKQSAFLNVANEEFDNIHNLFASILAKGIRQQLRQGLYREYLDRQEDLPVIRGKIDIPGTIGNKISHRNFLTCDFDELSENNAQNQILKTTVMILLRHASVEPIYKDELKKEMQYLSNVVVINPKNINWKSLQYRRDNQTYRMLMNICQLIHEGMLMTTEEGDLKLTSFIDDLRMHKLFEKFFLEFYKKEYPQIKVHSPRIDWALDDSNAIMLPVMQSDITLTKGNQTLIIDAKYYSQILQEYHNHSSLRSGHLYQIFTYVKNKSIEFKDTQQQVSGMLLYAKTTEELQPDIVYRMSGNKISIKSLDLNQDFPYIVKQLHTIIDEHFSHY